MIDWALVDEEESAAIVAYAQLSGMTPDDFAKATLAALRAAERTFSSAQISIGGEKHSLAIDESLSPVPALIALGRSAAKSTVAQLSGLMRRHVEMYGPLYAIDLEALKSQARIAGVGTDQSGWIEEFLQEIPIVIPFSPNIDAFVSLFPDKAPKIVVSANLHNVFDLALVPLLLNIVSEDGKAVPLIRRRLSRDLVELAVDVILATADTYLHKAIRALDPYLLRESQNSWVLRHTEVVDTFGALIAWGSMDFVFLHELAHVVLGHAGVHPKRDELGADNLAINCLLQQSREMSDGDDLLTPFAAAGAILPFYFFEVLDSLSGSKTSDSHPAAVFRRAALSLAILGAMTKGLPLQNYQGLNQVAHVLFSATLKRTGSPSRVAGASDLDDLHGFRVVVIPSIAAPYVNIIQKASRATN